MGVVAGLGSPTDELPFSSSFRPTPGVLLAPTGRSDLGLNLKNRRFDRAQSDLAAIMHKVGHPNFGESLFYCLNRGYGTAWPPIPGGVQGRAAE